MPAHERTIDGPITAGPSGMTATGRPIALGTLAVQAWADMGTEAVRFLQNRLQQDIQTRQAMLACTSLAAMQQVQTEYFTAAQQQYAAEAVRMLDLMGRAAAVLMTATAARRYDDVPL